MPVDRRRIMVNVYEAPFRVLGYDPEKAGATQVTAALNRYASHVAVASLAAERLLNRAEWNAIADVMNGCADLWDYAGSGISQSTLIRANVEDAAGLGAKWFGGDDGEVNVLLGKLRTLTEIEAEAVGAAVRYFWTNCHEIDHDEDEWWTLEFRTGKGSLRRLAPGGRA